MQSHIVHKAEYTFNAGSGSGSGSGGVTVDDLAALEVAVQALICPETITSLEEGCVAAASAATAADATACASHPACVALGFEGECCPIGLEGAACCGGQDLQGQLAVVVSSPTAMSAESAALGYNTTAFNAALAAQLATGMAAASTGRRQLRDARAARSRRLQPSTASFSLVGPPSIAMVPTMQVAP